MIYDLVTHYNRIEIKRSLVIRSALTYSTKFKVIYPVDNHNIFNNTSKNIISTVSFGYCIFVSIIYYNLCYWNFSYKNLLLNKIKITN